MHLRSALFLFAGLGLIPFGALAEPAEDAAKNPATDQYLKEITDQAPSALLATKIDDVGVEFFMQGYWKTGIGLGFQTPVVGTRATGLSDYQLVPWNNAIDLTLSLWINQQFFFESKIHDSLETNTYLLGYEKAAAVGLQSLYIGNSRIGSAFKYEGIHAFPAADGLAGVALQWKGESSSHEAFVRLRTGETVQQDFRGSVELSTVSVSAAQFLKNRLFQLPHENIANLTLWQESDSGTLASDGRRYATLTADRITSIDLSHGVIFLKEATKGRLLASYNVGGGAWYSVTGGVGFPEVDNTSEPGRFTLKFTSAAITFDPATSSPFVTKVHAQYETFYGRGTPTDINSLKVTIDGATALLVFRPEERSPFENASMYGLNTGTTDQTRVTVTLPDTTDRSYAAMPDGSTVRLLGNTSVTFADRYPLIDLGSVGMRSYDLSLGSSSLPQVAVQNATAVTTISLAKDALPDSIQVYRNGSLDPTFVYDASNRTLTSPYKITDSDEVRVVYRVYNRLGSEQLLQFFLGNIFNLGKGGGTLQVGFSSDLSLQSGSYSRPDYPTPANFRLEAALNQKLGPVAFKLGLWGGLTLPDTKALSRIRDFAETTVTMGVGVDRVFPAPASTVAGFSNSNRGASGFLDFSSSSGFKTWDAYEAAGTTPSYTNGDPIGPSIASSRSDDPTSGSVIVMPYSLNGTTETWVGYVFRFSESERQGLSTAQALSFWIRGRNIQTNAPTIGAWIGRPSEDLDGNGAISKSTGTGTTGFAFSDSAHGLTLYAGSQASDTTQRLGEDFNNNGLLEGEEALNLVTLLDATDPVGPTVPPLTTGDSLRQVQIRLDDRLRSALAQSTAIYFVVSTSAAASTNGTVVCGGFRILGGGLGLRTDSSNPVSFSSNSAGFDTETTSLKQAFTSMNQVLTGTETNQLIRIEHPTGTDNVYLSIPTGQFSFGGYEHYAIHVKPNQAVTAVLKAITINGTDRTNHSPLTLQANVWNRLLIDLEKNTVNLVGPGDQVLASASLLEPSLQTIGGFEVDFGSVAANAIILVDELIAYDPYTSFRGDGRIEASWEDAKANLEIGQFRILGRPSLSVLGTGTFAGSLGTTRNQAAVGTFATQGSIELLYTKWEIGVQGQYRATDNQTTTIKYAGHHDISLPYPGYLPLVLQDSFAQNADASSGYTKKNRFSLNLPSVLKLAIGSDATVDPQLLHRLWSLDISTPEDLGINLALRGSVGLDARPSALPTGNYGTDWLSGLTYQVVTDETAKLNRVIGAKLQLSGTDKGLQPSLSLEAGYSRGQFAGYGQEQRLRYGLAYLIAPANTGLGLQIGYSRETIARSVVGLYGPIGDELTELGRVWAQEASSLAGIPVVDLFVPSNLSTDANLPQASVRPELTIQVKRQVKNNWFDLLLPNQVGLTLSNLQTASLGVQSNVFSLGLNFKTETLSLFGRLGTQKLFDFYNNDHIVTAFSGSVGIRGQQVVEASLSYDLTPELNGMAPPVVWSRWQNRPATMTGIMVIPPPFTFKLPLGLTWSASDLTGIAWRAGVEYNWLNDVPASIDFRLDTKKKNPIFMAHFEDLKLRIQTTTGPGLASQNLTPLATLGSGAATASTFLNFRNGALTEDGWRLELSHRTVLALPDFGYLSAALKVAYQSILPYGLGAAYQLAHIGIQLDLEAKIVF